MRRSSTRGITVVEFLAVSAIVVVIVLVLYPVLAQQREVCGPRRHACNTHLRQLGVALTMYVMDADDRLPADGNGTQALPSILHPYSKNGTLWRCLKDANSESVFDESSGDRSVSYGYNWLTLSPDGIGIMKSEVRQPAETVLILGSTTLRAAPAGLFAMPVQLPMQSGVPVARHTGKINVLRMGGHVKSMRLAALDERLEKESGVKLGPGVSRYRYWNRY